MTQMQGIVSILRSDNPERTTKAASLRRTLSADMSSKKWLTDNGLLLMKKIELDCSSPSSSSQSDEEECAVTGKGDENPSRMDIWTAIMSQKKQDDSIELPSPYVHPLVRKSASSLSEKSLKVCTESLGSETGSDIVFSSAPSSQISDDDLPEDNKVVKFACLTSKKSQLARSFPPPLPSLASARADGASLHMHSRRVNGRLVVEAISVPPQKYFEFQRQDGRFLLTLINDDEQEHEDEDEDEVNSDTVDNDIEILNEPPLNSTMPIKLEAVEEQQPAVTQSLPPSRLRTTGLPPLPPPTSTTFVNSNQNFRCDKPTVANVIEPVMSQHRPPTKAKELVLLRGNKADSVLPSLKGCKEARRSQLMWEPFCIATS